MTNWITDLLKLLVLPKDEGGLSRWVRLPALGLVVYLLVSVPLGMWWSVAPDQLNVEQLGVKNAAGEPTATPAITGYATTATLAGIINTLLDKPGGFIENDKFPPGLWLDNMPNWEFGVVQQVRDMARILRNDMSRSQSQSVEDKALVSAETRLHVDTQSWMFPRAEGEYRQAAEQLAGYLQRLQDNSQPNAQFYARADNLRNWLEQVEKRLGSLSQRLSASVGKEQLNTDLANDPVATRSTPAAKETFVKTSWWEIDDVFHQARGASWAILTLMKAIEIDFADVLENKNARVSVQQIIRELEGSQRQVWSPMIMNGNGFGMFANHSLVMGSYISRANAAVIDLRELLQKG